MKHLISLSIIIILFSNCSKKEYIHLYQVKPKWESKGEDYVFENDTVRVSYSFWSESGTFAFSFYNKLNTPLYIDWKKSSFIKNGNKLNYWSDETITKGRSFNAMQTRLYNKTLFSSDEGFSNSVSIKPEMVTFVAPKSTIYKVQFELQSEKDKRFDTESVSTEEVTRVDKPKKKTNLLYKTYNDGNSKLFFRNYMTFSTSDKFETESNIDNAFYLHKVTEMDLSYFFNNKRAAYFSAEYNFEKNYFKSPYQNRLNYYTIVK